MKKMKEGSIVKGIVTGVCVACVLSIVLSALFAGLITGERIGEESVFLVGMGVTAFSVLIGCVAGTHQYKDKTLVVTMSVFISYTLLMMLIGFAVYGNVTNAGFYNVPAGLICSAAVCLLRAGKGRRHHR